jgi:hypothetical protein
LNARAHATDHGEDTWQRQLSLVREGNGNKAIQLVQLVQHRIVQGGRELKKDRGRVMPIS